MRVSVARQLKRIKELSRIIGIPVVCVGGFPERSPEVVHLCGVGIVRFPAEFYGPTLKTWISWKSHHKTPAVYINFTPQEYAWKFNKEFGHVLLHELTHALVWLISGLDPNKQDEYAGFLCIERAMARALGMGGKSWQSWQGDSYTPVIKKGCNVPWESLSYRTRSSLYRQSEKYLLEGYWEKKDR